jgi:anti-sigma-K factor RskA
MDIREYIQSGIIEQYVLGLASAPEAAELEQLRKQHPELNEAVLNFENSLEEHLMLKKVQPPAHIKSLLQKQLFEESSLKAVAPILSREKATSINNTNLWKYLAAASIVLLIVSTALNFYFYSGYKNSAEQYQALLTERNTLQANNAVNKSVLDSMQQNIQQLQTNNENYKDQVASLQQSFKIMHDPDFQEIKLKGILNKSDLATIYWDKKNRQVYFFKNYMKETPAGKQYQLWAIVHGKPVSAGLIGTCYGLCKMKIIPEAEAFAVTLEKEGGSNVPTLTQMYVMGKT